MKKIAFLVLAAVSISAHATDYEGEARRQSFCEDMAAFGTGYYALKQKGGAYEVGFTRDGTEKGRLVEKIANYGYHYAKSEKDAYLVGWGMCMDTVNGN